jgi:hypothetical protein
MGRATLTQVRSFRKAWTCDDRTVPAHPIPKGSAGWTLSAFRQVARFCAAHKPSDERVANFAPKSRADRAGDAAGAFNDAASELSAIADEIRSALGEADDGEADATNDLSADTLAELDALRVRLEAVGVDGSEVESLAEEMRTWADNLEGGNLGSTSKCEEVSECADELEGVEVPDVPSAPGEATREAWEACADECEEAASALEEAASTVEGVNFPTAF